MFIKFYVNLGSPTEEGGEDEGRARGARADIARGGAAEDARGDGREIYIDAYDRDDLSLSPFSRSIRVGIIRFEMYAIEIRARAAFTAKVTDRARRCAFLFFRPAITITESIYACVKKTTCRKRKRRRVNSFRTSAANEHET